MNDSAYLRFVAALNTDVFADLVAAEVLEVVGERVPHGPVRCLVEDAAHAAACESIRRVLAAVSLEQATGAAPSDEVDAAEMADTVDDLYGALESTIDYVAAARTALGPDPSGPAATAATILTSILQAWNRTTATTAPTPEEPPPWPSAP